MIPHPSVDSTFIKLKEFTMSMINGMYVAFSILMAFAVLMAWWSVRQKSQEEKEKEQRETKTAAADKKGEQS
jgi:Na+-transporting methylmalonyl-CoA/oxaloacetate decarboxylase gamma subunit